MLNNYLWTEKYRPVTLADCILPERIMKSFRAYVETGELTDLILTGNAGVGKTSVAIAVLNDLGCDYLKLNSSLEKGIDSVKDKIMTFASTVSFTGGKKFIILDEADGMLRSTQESLKAFIEEFSSNCGYIFICNNASRIIDPIKSRCKLIDFSITKEDFPVLAKAFYERLETIFETEGVTYDRPSVAHLIKKCYPDWRKVLVSLQDYSNGNNKTVDSGILGSKMADSFKELVALLKAKKWNDMRKWVGENTYILSDFTGFARQLQAELEPLTEVSCWPNIVLSINDFDYRDNFIVDKEINVAAFLTRLMQETTWK